VLLFRRSFFLPIVGQFSDRSNPQQMHSSLKSVELYEKEGVFTYEELAQEDCHEIRQPWI
jgi:hypothetical protein